MKVITSVPENRIYTLDEAFAYCAVLTESHYENFPVASLFLPAEKRPLIQALYAFSRTADDFADEPGCSHDERIQLLNDWEIKLQNCYDGTVEHPVFIALREVIRKHDLPINPLRDLLTAFRRDVTQTRYQSFDDLMTYCACSANPVGRLMLMIFGYRDEELFKLSDAICTALQLTNFWQDVKVDLLKDRLYIPLDDMSTFGYSENDWKMKIANTEFTTLMKFQVDRTREMFYAGAELPALVDRDLQLELKLVWFGGMSILQMLDRSRYDVFAHRPSLRFSNKLMILLRGLVINDLVHYKRKKPIWDLT